MAKHWFLDETPPETPEFGGYSHGVIDKNNPEPEGAQVLNNDNQLKRAVYAADKKFAKAIEEVDQTGQKKDR